MPTYEYECKKCGHRFEAFQQMADKPLERCPKCSSSVKRLIGMGAGIIFKGKGFYATDYKNKSGKGGQKSCPKAGKDNRRPCGSCSANNSGER